jgi:hypothetical protein
MQTPPVDHQAQQRPPTNSALAVASLIASILGVTLLPTVGSIAGLIMGYIAKRRIEKSGGAIGGGVMAHGGIVVGWVGIGLTALGIFIGLVILAVVGIGLGSF